MPGKAAQRGLRKHRRVVTAIAAAVASVPLAIGSPVLAVQPAAPASDVTLVVDPSNGATWLANTSGSAVITSYYISSASGSLKTFPTSGFKFLGNSLENNPNVYYTASDASTHQNWTGQANFTGQISEGPKSNYSFQNDSTWNNYRLPQTGYYLGKRMLTLTSGGTKDLQFQWGDTKLNSSSGNVDYVIPFLEPIAFYTGAGTDNKMSNPANWENVPGGGVPGQTDSDVYFWYPSAINGNNVINVDGGSFPGIDFANTAGPYTLVGNAMALYELTNDTIYQQVISTPLTLPSTAGSRGTTGLSLSGNFVINGQMTGAGLSVQGEGPMAATVTLAGSNLYSGGTTVGNGATLVAQNPAALGTGSVSVTAGGTLQGSAAFRGVLSLSANGTLTPGTNGSGSFATTSSATLSGGVLNITINDTTATAAQISANGITLGASLQLTGLSSTQLPPGTVLKILDNTSSQPISGIFAGLANGATISDGANTFTISYFGGDNNDVTLTEIPEPAGASLLLSGVALQMLRRRRTIASRHRCLAHRSLG